MHAHRPFRFATAGAAVALALSGCAGHNSVVGMPAAGGGPLQIGASASPASSTISLKPTSLLIRGTTSASTRTFTATDTQRNFHGTFTAVSTNPAIATVSPSSVTGKQSAVFTVTGAGIGTCSITVKDGKSTKSEAITVVTAHGIYVTNRGSESIEDFNLNANGNIAPLATWSGSNTKLNAVNLLTVDPLGDVIASNIGPGISGSVTFYAPNPTGNAAPTALLTGPDTGIDTPEGLFVDSAGDTYVANVDRITEYAPGANGDAKPIRTIMGSNTILSGPYELTVDASGKIYVAEGNVILVFAANATGNATPVQEITGPATGLLSALGVAVDAAGNIWVTNFNGNTINEYAPGTTGDAQPSGVVTSTALNEPYNIALDAKGQMYVTNFGNNTIAVFPAGSVGVTNPTATIGGSGTGLNQPQGISVY